MSLNRRLLMMLWLLTGLLVASPLWAQGSISLSCPTQVTGTTIACTTTLNLPAGTPIDSFGFNLKATAIGATPAFSAAGSFSTAGGLGNATTGGQLTSGIAQAAAAWLNLTPVVSAATTTLGTATFTLPAGAAGGSYSIAFTKASIDGSCCGDGGATVTLTTDTAKTVQVFGVTGPATLNPLAVGSTYTASTFTVGGAIGSISWSSPNLPLGLTLNSGTGQLTGSPNTAGTNVPITVNATDAGTTNVASKTYTVTINSPIVITPAQAALPTGTVGNVYNTSGFQLSASGGSGSPFTFGASAALTNTGLTISSAGLISGNPTTGTPTPNVTVTITVTDSAGSTRTRDYTLTVNGPLSISTPSPLPTATVGAPYTTTIQGGGGSGGGYTWSATGVPINGLSFAGGVLSGTPTGSGGTVTISVTLTDSAGGTFTKSFDVPINPALLITPAVTVPTLTVNWPYTGPALAATGGAGAPYAWSLTGQPTGPITIDSATGVISGTPSASGTFNATLSVSDKNSVATTTQPLTFTVVPALVVGPTSVKVPTKGQAYSDTITATGGTTPYTFTVLSGTLPSGLSMSAAGAITGTPDTAGPTSFTVQVEDANQVKATKLYTPTVNQPVVFTLPTINAAAVGSSYSLSFAGATTGGAGTFTYTTTSTLPTGLTWTAPTISGIPAAGTNSVTPYSITVVATDVNGATASQTFGLTVNAAISISPASVGPFVINIAPTAVNFTATGGAGSFTYTATGVPTSMTFAAGVLSGTPTASGSFTLAVTATDSATAAATKNYTVVVNPALSINALPASLPAGTTTAAYPATTMGAAGGLTPYVWSITGPAGMTIDPATGVIGGTITDVAATYSVVVTVQDATLTSVPKTFTGVVINPKPSILTPTALTTATVNFAYPATAVTGTGGTGALTFSVSGLPNGMNLTSNSIGGIPLTNAATPYSVVITATDSLGATGTSTLSLAVNTALTITGPATLPVGIPSVAYTATTITGTGGAGSAAFRWSATGLPTGMSIAQLTGIISGTPANNTGNPYSVVVTLTDGLVSTTKTYTLVINPPLSITGPATLPGGTANNGYPSTTVAATGGSGSYTFSATGLPAGLSISTAGTISGTPATAAGSPYSVVVTVTDSLSITATKSYTLVVSALPLQITTLPIPTAVLNLPYPTFFFDAVGGQGNFTFSATGLPPGLTVSSAGQISGTPTSTAGSPYSVVITVKDAGGTSVSRTYSLVVSGVLTITSPSGASLPAGALNSVYGVVTVTSGGGVAPYTWAATGLPAGLAIGAASGQISGTPTSSAGSPFTVVVTVTDATNTKASKTYTLAVNAPLTVAGPGSLPAGQVGVAYPSTLITATGGSGTYTYSASGLPSGLSINPAIGAITGTPTTSLGTPFAVVITVTDSAGNSTTQTYALAISAAPVAIPTITSVSTATAGQLTVAPNTYVSIYGTNFAPAGFTDDWTTLIKNSGNGTLPTTLDGVSVTVSGLPAYVSYVSATQVNILMPNVGQGPMQLTISTAVGSSVPFTVTAQQYSPSLFPWPQSQPVATHTDYSYAAKPGTFPAQPNTIAAKPGETIVVWGTGFGPTSPQAPFGVSVPTTSVFSTSSNVSATLASAPIAVYQNVATLASGFAGLYQIGITIPTGQADGDYPLVLTVNGVSTPAATLSVRK